MFKLYQSANMPPSCKVPKALDLGASSTLSGAEVAITFKLSNLWLKQTKEEEIRVKEPKCEVPTHETPWTKPLSTCIKEGEVLKVGQNLRLVFLLKGLRNGMEDGSANPCILESEEGQRRRWRESCLTCWGLNVAWNKQFLTFWNWLNVL